LAFSSNVTSSFFLLVWTLFLGGEVFFGFFGKVCFVGLIFVMTLGSIVYSLVSLFDSDNWLLMVMYSFRLVLSFPDS